MKRNSKYSPLTNRRKSARCVIVKIGVIRPERQRGRVFCVGAMRCRNKFKAQLRVNGKTIHLGVFSTAQEASAAWMRAKQKAAV